MFTFPSQKQTQGHYRRSYPWCNNRNKGVWKEDWKKGKASSPFHPLAVHSPATLQTNIRLGGRGSVRSVPLVLNRQHPQDPPESPLTPCTSFPGTLLLCRSISSSYNVGEQFLLLLAPRQLRDTAAMGEEGVCYVCARMYVLLVFKCVRSWVREYESNGGRSHWG